ncbi:MAG: HD domain-containing protein [Myxococcales bacterium]|nr:HD domain-containing protein [Myxococcales bacterium]
MARLSELLGALSLATDLAAGVPLETSLRTCVVSTWLASRAGITGEALRAVYYGTLLRHVGCTAWSHEAAEIAAGDDHDLLRTFEGTDHVDRRGTAARAVKHLARGASPFARVAAVTKALTRPAAGVELAAAQCGQARALAADLGLDPAVGAILEQIYERWDGLGPRGLAGVDVHAGARVLHVGQLLEIHTRRAGAEAALATLVARQGGQLDPSLVAAVVDGRTEALAALRGEDLWERFLACEPTPLLLSSERIESTAQTFGRYADLKIPDRIGHSARVSELVARGGRALGLTPTEIERVVLAGHLHDLGVVAIPNGVWEHRGALGVGAWEAVRLHAYHGERVLTRCAVLAELAPIVGAHHERLDGTGYHRGTSGPAVGRLARLLAAADVRAALERARPHRPAFGFEEAVRTMRELARGGTLCAASVEAVLAGSEASPQRPPRHPTGLTAREIEVIAALARGATNKEIAVALAISPRTVQHHLEHVYAKIGATTRAAAALFAARNDLLVEPSADD